MLESGFTRVGEFHYLHHDQDGRPYANIAEHAERVAAAEPSARAGDNGDSFGHGFFLRVCGTV